MADTNASFRSSFNSLKYYQTNYDEVYQRSWILISEKVIYLLKRGPHALITFEPLYSQIYRTVCAGKSDKMFNDLMLLVAKHLNEVDITLGSRNEISLEHFLHVTNAMKDYIGSIKKMTLVFSYFNKKYVLQRLSSDLLFELGTLFYRNVLERRIPALMAVAEEALRIPCSYSPTIFHRFCKDLWIVCNRQLPLKYPRVFSRYYPRNPPETNETEEETNPDDALEFEDILRERLIARTSRLMRRRRGLRRIC